MPTSQEEANLESQYEKALAGIIAKHDPVSGIDLAGMIEDFAHSLEASAPFFKVRVRRTGDPKAQVEASGVSCAGGITPPAAAQELERVWSQELRYVGGEEAHTISITEDAVLLSAVTVSAGYYVSARVSIAMKPSGQPLEAGKKD